MIVMVFDIGNLHVKGRKWKVGNGRSRGLLLKGGIRKGGKREGRVRENKIQYKIVPAPWPVSINFAARLKRYRRHGP